MENGVLKSRAGHITSEQFTTAQNQSATHHTDCWSLLAPPQTTPPINILVSNGQFDYINHPTTSSRVLTNSEVLTEELGHAPVTWICTFYICDTGVI